MLGTRDIKKAVNKTMKKMEKVDWNKTAHNASSIAGTVGGAMALAKLVTKRTPFRRRKMDRIMNPVKIGAASVAIVAGGLKLFNDNMPKEAKKLMKKTRKTTDRYMKMMR
jgi:hypothetical protein